MFYHLFYPLSSEYSFLNVFKYITFRSAYSGVTALVLSLTLGNLMIRMLQKFQIGETIRSDGPEHHASKSTASERISGEPQSAALARGHCN